MKNNERVGFLLTFFSACVMRTVVFNVLCCLLLIGRAWGDTYEFVSNGSPLVSHISAADPDAHVWGDTVWVYCSMDANLRDHGKGADAAWTYEHMDGYHAFSSTDMVNWVDHGEIFHSRNVAWGPPGWMWAPSAAWNGKRGDESLYYLYFPHKDWDGNWKIGIATAPTPAGPFVDSGKPIEGIRGIDPKLFIDDDKQVYLYFNSAAVVRLKDNMMEIAEQPRQVDYGSSGLADDKFRFEEGSFMHKRNGVYVYSYSNWQAKTTTSYYATGSSPYGPFKWQGALAGKKSGAQDHHSIVKFKGNWYYFYHMDTPWYIKNDMQWAGQRRIACYTRMYHSFWTGSIQLVNPTSFLVDSGGLTSYTTNTREMYQFDLWFSPSSSQKTDASIAGTVDPRLYQTYRYAQPSLSYDIPLANGKYEITFRWAELYHDEAGKRVFDVSVEQKPVVRSLDVFARVGKHAALDMKRTVTVSDNELNIEFLATTDYAMISAMKIVRKRCLLLGQW